jgi:hypothetical protein
VNVLTRRLPKLVVSLALGAVFAWLFARGGLPLVPSLAALSALPSWVVPGYLGSLVLVHLLRASRWRFLIAPVRKLPMRDVILLNWIGFFAIFALPLRLGELARPALTKLRYGVPISVGLGTEIVDAARRAMVAGVRPEDLDEQRFAGFLYTAGQPDPDLLIRTSGEMRVSNYLLWQIAYSEIYVTDTLWPDFRRRHLFEAVLAYQKRERRYGGITAPAVIGAQ